VRAIAYLDAGSTSMIAGAIAAGGAAVVVFFKTQFHRVGGVFKRKSATKDASAAVDATPDEA